jgi:hypothetical protein
LARSRRGGDIGPLVFAHERISVMHVSKLRLVVGGVITAVSFSLLGAGTAYAVQPHMVAARNSLQAALNELNLADPDKGGHRVSAINLVNQAIDQVNQGINFAGG